MTKFSILLLTLFVLTCQASAQAGNSKKQLFKKDNALTLGAHLPIGEFSRSHIVGISVEYWRAPVINRHDSSGFKRIMFFVAGGGHYFLGKDISVASYDFKFSNFLTLHLLPGLKYVPVKKLDTQIAAGPIAALYKKNIRGGLVANLSVAGHFTKQIAMGPSVYVRKFSDSKALWSIGIGVNYYLQSN